MNNTAVHHLEANDDIHRRVMAHFSHYKKQKFHYLDNAATTQKPNEVIDAISLGYREFCAPVHRASYVQGESASQAYEDARKDIATFIGANGNELVFTKSCTEAINMVALGWARNQIKPHHKIWVSRMEHNANYLPWHQLCKETGAELKVIEMDEQGRLILEDTAIWDKSTLLIAVTHSSNVLGGENPIEWVCKKAREHGICTLIDAAQSVSHKALDIHKIGCDFLAFSAHKMYGPDGIGALYINQSRQSEMTPVQMGGGIVSYVSDTEITLREPPYCFEAGSPNLSGALGFQAAVKFIQSLGHDAIQKYIGELSLEFQHTLANQTGITLLPFAGGENHSSVISFTVDGIHPHDVADTAADYCVAMRTGNHCSHLLFNKLNINACNRISLGMYNTQADIDPLIQAIKASQKMFL